jgi:hypothetical protein
MTSIPLPRLLSEYFAALAQSDALISAKVAGDVASNDQIAMNHGHATNGRWRCRSGERRLPACSIRQLAECISQSKN